MCILIILPSLVGGGAERVCLNLARRWVDIGLSVIIVTVFEGGELEAEATKICEVIKLRLSRLRNTVKPLHRLFRQLKPTAIFVQMWPLTITATISWVLAGRSGKLILVEHIPLLRHDGNKGVLSALTVRVTVAFFFPLASFVIGVSDGVALQLSRLAFPFRLNLRRIYNPVVASNYLNLLHEEDVCDLEKSCEKKVILNVANLKLQKNHALLLRSFKKSELWRDTSLVILGDGTERANLQDLIAELNLQNSVFLKGFVVDTDCWFRRADLFVLSSDYEGLPTVLIEALAAGVPVVSTDCCYGPSEIIEDGVHGLLCKVGSEDALSLAMVKAFQMSFDKDILRRRALDFTVESASDQYLGLIT